MLSIRNVVLGISGGVDSAVAGILLKKKGFNVIGVFMRNWDLADENGLCSVEEDLEDAKFVCKRLDIPFHEVNFVKQYWNEVFSSFIDDYESGLTPNPDVLCNKLIKFKAFYSHAIRDLKADAIATGHYAKTSFGDFLENYKPGVNVKLFRPRDTKKDQTLFLSQIFQEPLRKTMFPLSNLTKDVVRKIAIENGLEKIAKKRESTGICFIGKREFSKFMSDYVTPKPGNFIELSTGNVVGTHNGIHLYTLGQRTRIVSSEALYVAKKKKDSSDMFVVQGRNHPFLFSSMFFTDKPHWIAEPPDLSSVMNVDFRFQHTKNLTKCTLFKLKSGDLIVLLSRPLRALTPGQFAAFYKNDECLGSAKITLVGPSEFSLGKIIPNDYLEYENENSEVYENIQNLPFRADNFNNVQI